jgi:hypothetical protein
VEHLLLLGEEVADVGSVHHASGRYVQVA